MSIPMGCCRDMIMIIAMRIVLILLMGRIVPWIMSIRIIAIWKQSRRRKAISMFVNKIITTKDTIIQGTSTIMMITKDTSTNRIKATTTKDIIIKATITKAISTIMMITKAMTTVIMATHMRASVWKQLSSTHYVTIFLFSWPHSKCWSCDISHYYLLLGFWSWGWGYLMESISPLRSHCNLRLLHTLFDCNLPHHPKLLLFDNGVNSSAYWSRLTSCLVLKAVRGAGHPRYPRLGSQTRKNDHNRSCSSQEEYVKISVDPADW